MMIINKINEDIKKKYKKYLFQNGNLFLINRNNIIHNSSIISKKSKNALICPVIKADAYGLGVLKIISILIELGYQKMFLANISEGIEVRRKYKNIEIYILNIGKPFNTKILPVDLSFLNSIASWVVATKKCLQLTL